MAECVQNGAEEFLVKPLARKDVQLLWQVRATRALPGRAIARGAQSLQPPSPRGAADVPAPTPCQHPHPPTPNSTCCASRSRLLPRCRRRQLAAKAQQRWPTRMPAAAPALQRRHRCCSSSRRSSRCGKPARMGSQGPPPRRLVMLSPPMWRSSSSSSSLQQGHCCGAMACSPAKRSRWPGPTPRRPTPRRPRQRRPRQRRRRQRRQSQQRWPWLAARHVPA